MSRLPCPGGGVRGGRAADPGVVGGGAGARRLLAPPLHRHPRGVGQPAEDNHSRGDPHVMSCHVMSCHVMSCHVMSPEVPMVRTQLLEDHPADQPPPVRSGLPGAPDLRERGEAWDHFKL